MQDPIVILVMRGNKNSQQVRLIGDWTNPRTRAMLETWESMGMKFSVCVANNPNDFLPFSVGNGCAGKLEVV